MIVGAALIIPTFVLWGVGSAIRSEKKAARYAGELFGEKITFERFYKSFNVTRQAVVKNYSIEFPQEVIADMAWSRLILIEEARRRKITVNNEELAAEIKSLPQFQTNGVFSLTLYKDMLGDRARLFEEELKNDLLIKKLKDAISNDVHLSEDELKAEYTNQNEKAKISYVIISPDSLKDKITVTDEEIASYFNNNKERFKKPIEVNLEYVEISPELIDKIDEAGSNRTNDLKDLSRLFSLTIKETGFFAQDEPAPGIGLIPDIHQEAFKLKEGRISEPIETPKGYIIIRLKERRQDYIPSLEEVKEKVKEAAQKTKAKESAKKTMNELYASVKEAIENNKDAKFEQVLQTKGAELKQSQGFSRKDYIAGLGPASSLKEAAFGMKAGDISGVIEVETGFCIFRLDELIPVDEEKFKKDLDTFSTQLLETKRQEYFNKWFDSLRLQATLKSNL